MQEHIDMQWFPRYSPALPGSGVIAVCLSVAVAGLYGVIQEPEQMTGYVAQFMPGWSLKGAQVGFNSILFGVIGAIYLWRYRRKKEYYAGYVAQLDKLSDAEYIVLIGTNQCSETARVLATYTRNRALAIISGDPAFRPAGYLAYAPPTGEHPLATGIGGDSKQAIKQVSDPVFQIEEDEEVNLLDDDDGDDQNMQSEELFEYAADGELTDVSEDPEAEEDQEELNQAMEPVAAAPAPAIALKAKPQALVSKEDTAPIISEPAYQPMTTMVAPVSMARAAPQSSPEVAERAAQALDDEKLMKLQEVLKESAKARAS